MSLQQILVVEDEPDIRTILRLSLETVGGYSVVFTTCGAEGVEAAREQPFDLILLDLMMPGMDGLETLARLREQPESDAIPVIFMTARVQPQEVARYLAAGAAGVIAKPFDPMQLPSQILGLLTASGRGVIW